MAAPVEIGPASAQEVQASAAYTPSDDAPDVTYSNLKVKTLSGHAYGHALMSGDPDHNAYTESIAEVGRTLRGMKSAWNTFRQALATTAPDLAKKEFSFSVDKNGDMVATNPHGALTASQMRRITELMNKSGAFKNATKEFAERTIDFANNGGTLMGVNLEMSNFQQSLDIGMLLEHSQQKPGQQPWEFNLQTQISTNGEPRIWVSN
jgi:hypothetical protein